MTNLEQLFINAPGLVTITLSGPDCRDNTVVGLPTWAEKLSFTLFFKLKMYLHTHDFAEIQTGMHARAHMGKITDRQFHLLIDKTWSVSKAKFV